MNLQQAIAVILTLAKYLDGKASVVLSNEWKLKLARAISVLRENKTYAQTQDGMYLTIAISKVNGTASVTWMPIREEATASSNSLDELFNSMLTAQSGVQPVNATAPDLNL